MYTYIVYSINTQLWVHLCVENIWVWHFSLHWRYNGGDCVSNHQPHDCLLKRLFRRRSKKTSKLRVTGLCETSPGTDEFPAPQMGSTAENVYIWWRHHVVNVLSQSGWSLCLLLNRYNVVIFQWQANHLNLLTHKYILPLCINVDKGNNNIMIQSPLMGLNGRSLQIKTEITVNSTSCSG